MALTFDLELIANESLALGFPQGRARMDEAREIGGRKPPAAGDGVMIAAKERSVGPISYR